MHAKAIHAYFQHKKALLAKVKVSENLKNQEDVHASWILPDGAKYNSKTAMVCKLEGKENFYITMEDAEHLADTGLEGSFKKALQKGEISTGLGVKFLNKKGAELKVAGDNRIYSNEVYENEYGKYLVKFEFTPINHKAVKKLAREENLKVIKVPSYSDLRLAAHDDIPPLLEEGKNDTVDHLAFPEEAAASDVIGDSNES